MSVTFRPMTIEDYDAAVALWKTDEHLGFSESDDRARISRYLERNAGCSFVALDGEKVVGTVLAGEDARRGFINHLFVLEDHRGLGIGGSLAALAERALAKTSSTKSYVFVKHDNEAAARFWQRRGYYLCDDFCTMRRSLSDEPYAAYVELDEVGVRDYLVSRQLVPAAAGLSVEEFGDGNMNHIFRVSWDDASLIVKQSMPHGKIDVTCFEPVCRGVFESRYVSFYEKVIPEMIEDRLLADETMALSVYRDYSGFSTLRRELMAGRAVSGFGDFCGRYLARELFHSSVLGLGIERKKQLEPSFSNLRSRKLTEDYILVSPFFDSPDNCVDAVSRPLVEPLWEDVEVAGAARLLAMDFVSNKQCLIHGDFHPGNLFVGERDFIVSDFDFASWGPVAYDLGTMVGNLVLSHRTQREGRGNPAAVRASICREIASIYDSFEEELERLVPELGAAAVRRFCEDVFVRSLGYAGCTVAGRSYGYCRFPEITSINDDDIRAKVLTALLDDVRFLLLDAHNASELVERLCR